MFARDLNHVDVSVGSVTNTDPAGIIILPSSKTSEVEYSAVFHRGFPESECLPLSRFAGGIRRQGFEMMEFRRQSLDEKALERANSVRGVGLSSPPKNTHFVLYKLKEKGMKTLFGLLLAAVIMLSGVGCASQGPVAEKNFGKTKDGKTADIYTLTNKNGLKAKVTTYGAILTELWVPDKNGKLENVVLGFDNLASYEKHFSQGNAFLGATIGRYGNRIAKAKFTLNGQTYQLKPNEVKKDDAGKVLFSNLLHGGDDTMYHKVWNAISYDTLNGPSLVLTITSPDGEEGFPGNVKITVTYTLTNDNELKIDYQATSDKPTILNMTNHSYFNLAGSGKGSTILDHVITINADRYTPVDSALIPTGIAPVAGTALDLRKPTVIKERINSFGDLGGFDHNFVLNFTKLGDMTKAVTLKDPKSGRVMEITTTEPGIQFYTGMNQEGTDGINGPYPKYGGLCLETQHYPDSPNQPEFPSTMLDIGKVYKTTTVHKFSVEK